MAEITKDMKIGEIVEKYPDTIQVMMEHGLHCIGCHVSTFESLEQGCKGHGMSDQDVDSLLKKMNEVIKNKEVG